MESQKCTQTECKYPISCDHNNMCMEDEMQKSISSKKIKKTSTQKLGLFCVMVFYQRRNKMCPS